MDELDSSGSEDAGYRLWQRDNVGINRNIWENNLLVLDIIHIVVIRNGMIDMEGVTIMII